MIGYSFLDSTKERKIYSSLIGHSGDQLRQLDLTIFPEDADFLIQRGMHYKTDDKKDPYEIFYKWSQDHSIPVLIREWPVIRQLGTKHWFRFSWNSIFDDEGIHPYDECYNRWYQISKEHDIKTLSYRRRGSAVLFCLQRYGDTALNKLIFNNIDYVDYCASIIREIKTVTDRPIIIRGHPLDNIVLPKLKKIFNDCYFSKGLSLEEDFRRSWCMITYNSTSCVESNLYGTPTITLDPSAVAYSISQKSITDIETPHEPDRSEWLKKISYMQWNRLEVESGLAWRFLKECMPKRK